MVVAAVADRGPASARPATESFADYRDRNLPPVRGATVLEQEDTLPGSKPHFAVDNRDGLARSRQHHSDVRRHVIAAFRPVSKVISIFRHQAIEEFLQVTSRRRIGVLHNNDAATGMLHKDSHCPVSYSAPVDLRLQIISDFVESPTFSAKFELVMMDMH
jgi:hypothetical protein